MRRVFISDCEGPISKNDNAFEAAAHFVPNGDKLFELISKYDDALAGVIKKPNYNAGDTLKLILPFLIAYDVTDEILKKFSAENLVLIPASKNTLEHIRSIAASFIVSTSYEHYIRALCQTLSFPFENTYCTRLRLDNYTMPLREKSQLRELATEIAQKPMVAIPPAAKSLGEFSKQDREIIQRLDEIFWEKISSMDAGSIFQEVKPIGGHQKAEAVKEVAEKSQVQLSDVLYVGDSITDVEAFKLVRESGGLTVSFNGNQYAVENAEVVVISDNNLATAIIAELWCRLDKRRTLEVLGAWSPPSLKRNLLSKSVLDQLFTLSSGGLPKLQIVTPKNMETLVHESSEFRKKVRGEVVGGLG